MEIVVWIVFGAVAGRIASLLVEKKTRSAIVSDVIIGIIGALVGGFAMNLFGQTSTYGVNIYSLAVAAAGAVILLTTYKTISEQIL